MQGTVRWFSSQGFGFIDALASTDGNATYFHITSVKHRAILKPGEAVVYDTVQDLKGLKAINVIRVVDTKEESQWPQTQTACPIKTSPHPKSSLDCKRRQRHCSCR